MNRKYVYQLAVSESADKFIPDADPSLKVRVCSAYFVKYEHFANRLYITLVAPCWLLPHVHGDRLGRWKRTRTWYPESLRQDGSKNYQGHTTSPVLLITIIRYSPLLVTSTVVDNNKNALLIILTMRLLFKRGKTVQHTTGWRNKARFRQSRVCGSYPKSRQRKRCQRRRRPLCQMRSGHRCVESQSCPHESWTWHRDCCFVVQHSSCWWIPYKTWNPRLWLSRRMRIFF